ncbi:MAG TPA: two-component regulator propeller domain-containing protein, partial [Cytophagaceae bacterium]
MPKNLLWLILFLLPCFSTAQRPDLLFHSLSVSDGLSENTVRSIIEDKMGYMWFASEDGLNKYNGYNFTVYRKDPTDTFSISNRNIKALFIDSKNTFWVLTSNGLNIYDAELDIFYNYRNNKYPALKRLAGDMEGMVEDKNGNFWVLTRDEGLFHISSLDQPPVNYPNIYNGSLISFKSIQLESDSMLLIGSRDGLFKFNCNTKKYIDFRPEYGQGYEINSMLKDSMNNIWLCSSHGLKLINSKGEFKQYLHNPADSKSINGNNIGDILLYKDNQYLVSIDGGGIDLFDYATSEFYHYQNSIPTPNIACLYKAPKGDLWVGTFLNGIYFSNPTTNLFKLIKNSPNATNGITKGMVTRFLKDSKGNLWLATDGGGVYKKRAGTEYFINYKEGEKGLTSNVIISIREDSEGLIWLTTYGGGVCKYDPAKDLFKAYRATPKSPNSLLSDLNKDIYEYDKKMWITGYGNGITLLDKKNETFSYLGNDITNIASNWVQTFLVDKENTLWLATFSGLCKYDLSTNTFKNYVFKNSGNEEAIDLNMIVDLVEDKNGDLWLGTMGNGLIYFNTTDGSYTIYT